jgi:hypothetical protein
MFPKDIRKYCVLALLVLIFAFPSCSREKEPGKEGSNAKPVTRQATEAIQDFGKKPIGKARAAQQLGDERTEAIDQAVEDKEHK